MAAPEGVSDVTGCQLGRVRLPAGGEGGLTRDESTAKITAGWCFGLRVPMMVVWPAGACADSARAMVIVDFFF